MHPLVKKLAQQTAIYGVSSILVRFLNATLAPIQTRAFDPDQFGIITEFYAYTALFNILFTYGMETAFFRYVTTRKNKKEVYDTSITSLIVSSVLFSSIIILFSKPISELLHYEGHSDYVMMFGAIMGLDAIVAIPFVYLRQENRPIRFAFYKSINIIVNVALNVILLVPFIIKKYYPDLLLHDSIHAYIDFFYHPEWGMEYVFFANLAASLITLLVMWRYFIIRNWQFSSVLLKEMLNYSWPLIIVGLAGMGNETFSRILLKYRFSGTKEQAMYALGVFGACYKMSILMNLFVQAYRMAAEPFFFNESQKKDPQITYARTMNFFVIFCCFIFLLITLNMDLFKHIFMTEKYYEGVRVVPILMMGYFFLGVYYNLTIWYKLTNRNFAGSLLAVGGVIITVILNWIWIPIYGYYGSSWVTFICYGSMMVVSYFFGQKFYPVPYDLKRFFIYVLLAIGFFFADEKLVSLLPDSLWILRYVYAATFMILFLSIVYFLESGKMKFLKPV